MLSSNNEVRNDQTQTTQTVTTKSGRQVNKPSRLTYAFTAELCAHAPKIEGELFCMEALCPDRDIGEEPPLHAFKATSDPDTMYHHQAMKQHDRKEFLRDMKKEIQGVLLFQKSREKLFTPTCLI